MVKIKTIAIGQGGGPTAVINDELAGALYEAQDSGIGRILGVRNGFEGWLSPYSNNLLDLTDWSHAHLRDRPGAILGTTRMGFENEDDGRIGIIRDHIEDCGADAFIYFGGNDSSSILQKVDGNTQIIHGAKTIDNDLLLSHHTPGFGSAGLFNARAVKKLSLDLFSYLSRDGLGYGKVPLVLYQTMGRDTGWLAHTTAFSRIDSTGNFNENLPPDIIWPAELEFDDVSYLGRVDDCLSKKGRAFVVISEGASKVVDGKKTPLATLSGKVSKDDSGHNEYGRAGAGSAVDYISNLSMNSLKSNNFIKPVVILPQHLQRCYERSDVDAEEAFRLGRETVRAVLDGESGISVVLQSGESGRIQPKRVPLEKIAGKIRYVDEEYYDPGCTKGPKEHFLNEFISVINWHNQGVFYDELVYKQVKLI